jgi:hypothetical protein
MCVPTGFLSINVKNEILIVCHKMQSKGCKIWICCILWYLHLYGFVATYISDSGPSDCLLNVFFSCNSCYYLVSQISTCDVC